jgi:DNA-binding NarL/FixJ family response regulator
MNCDQNNATKVAIIDDHLLIRECLFKFLTFWKYSIVIEACNGKDFLDKISENNLPDVCILDLNMPILNGYETIKILKKTWPCIKILVFSMNITKETAASSLNVDAVVSKTNSLTEIKNALQLLTACNKCD